MRIYLDHNATTPLRPEVLEAMCAALRDLPGNPSSTHAEGAAARAALEQARAQVAAAIGAAPGTILFTSGATESNNTALAGCLRAAEAAGRREIVTSCVEHPSVSEPLSALEQRGWRVQRLAVHRDGLLDPDLFAAALGAHTALAAILWANNETGVVQPAGKLVEIARARGVPIHLDATQCIGKLPVDVQALGVDSLAASGHKQNGPKGVGLLYVRPGAAFEPLLRGGPQERRRRGGTENLAGIVGLGVACELARREGSERAARAAALRDRLWEGIAAKIPGAQRNGSTQAMLPNTLNVRLPGVAGDVLLEALDLEGVAVSAGAACHSGSVEPSRILLAMGLSEQEARSSLRFSVGHGVDEAQIERVLTLLPDLVARVRAAAP
jgi:cysteine desulfurase